MKRLIFIILISMNYLVAKSVNHYDFIQPVKNYQYSEKLTHLEEDGTIDLKIGDDNPKRPLKYGFAAILSVDFINSDFSDFKTLLKEYNVDLMNVSNGLFNVEMGGTYQRYYAGLSGGFGANGVYDHDSLDIEFNRSQFGLHFGYHLLESKRLLVTPRVAVKWNRFRLQNNDKNIRIPIEQYVEERDLDLRFNQMSGSVGINLSYKMYNFNLLATDYWTVGFYGGYVFKLHDKPWIYSRSNRLTSNRKIGIDNYNIGINFSFNIHGQ